LSNKFLWTNPDQNFTAQKIVENTGKISFMLLSKACLSLPQFAWNWSFFSNLLWRTCVPNFMKIWQVF